MLSVTLQFVFRIRSCISKTNVVDLCFDELVHNLNSYLQYHMGDSNMVRCIFSSLLYSRMHMIQEKKKGVSLLRFVEFLLDSGSSI